MMNSDGTIEIRGRAADRLRFKVDRKAVWPSPIEEALKTHPSIREVKACILYNCALLGILLVKSTQVLYAQTANQVA